MNSKVTLNENGDVKISFATIAGMLFFANLITIEYFESSIYTFVRYVLLLLVLFYTLSKIYSVKISNMTFIFAISAIGILIVVSSYLGDVTGYNLRASVFYAAFLVVMSIFLIETRYIQELRNVLIGGKLYLMVILIITDLLMVVLPDKFYNISGRDIGTTLLGNKFNVAYAHLMLMFILIFLEERPKHRNRKTIIYAIIVAVICKFCDCTTAMLGCCLFLALYFIPKKFKEIFSKPVVVIALFFLTAFLLFAFNEILTLKPIQFLIVDVLHRDATLTGRMQVYPYLYKLISNRPLTGYGYGTSIVEKVSIWYANAQNGLLDFVIRYGCLTAVFLVLSILISAQKNNKNNARNLEGKNWLVLAMVYVYMFMGIAEITYSKQFLFYIILLYACSCVREC